MSFDGLGHPANLRVSYTFQSRDKHVTVTLKITSGSCFFVLILTTEAMTMMV